MGKRWAMLRVPLLAVLLVASLMVTYTCAFGDGVAVAAARNVSPARTATVAPEANVPVFSALVTPPVTPPVTSPVTPPVTPLTAPAGELPGYVFVVGNSEVVLERPSVEMDSPQGSSDDTAAGGTDSRSTSVAARAVVAPARLIVVDEDDQIIGIWSNTTGDKRGYYSLRTREGTEDGPEHPLTQEILAQYSRLLASLDWTICGRVY